MSKDPLTSDPRPASAGELYDLDASSLQLKVLQYVSPYAPPPAPHQGPMCLSSSPSQLGFPRPAPASFPPTRGASEGERVGSGRPTPAVSPSLGACLPAAAGDPGVPLLPPAGVRGQPPALL